MHCKTNANDVFLETTDAEVLVFIRGSAVLHGMLTKQNPTEGLISLNLKPVLSHIFGDPFDGTGSTRNSTLETPTASPGVITMASVFHP